MNPSTKDRQLTKKEKHIINLLNSNDTLCLKTFNLVYSHYLINFLMSKSNHFLVLKAIYLDGIDFPKWSLANYCNISRTALFNYRNDIIDCFYTCLNENIVTAEISATKGEK